MLCGIDEAGRGPLAGPVAAAAVILPKDFPVNILRDSKKLSEKKREVAENTIRSSKAFWAVGWASHSEIDALNILQATFLAMERAYAELYKKLVDLFKGENNEPPEIDIIVDGNLLPKFAGANFKSLTAIKKADDSIYEVMAASILAKTARDREMRRYADLYPDYGYEQHKGYGTKKHIEAIKKYGKSPIQRLSFSFK